MTTVQQIRKRDGRVVPFHENKIADAINKAFEATYKPGYEETAAKLAHEVASVLEVEGGNCPDVEHIQDIVERVLMDNGYVQTAKAYILYRSERNRAREMNTRLMKIYEDITFSSAKDSDIKRENANIDGDTAMGTMLKYGSEGSKQFYQMFVMKPEHARAHTSGDIHIHDMDFAPMGTTTCTQIDLIKLFDGGFSTGHGTLREPNDIASYAALACIAIQSNQNDQHGGQAIVNFDYSMAMGVRKTFQRIYRQNLARAVMLLEDRTDPESEIKANIQKIKEETGLYPKLEDCEEYFQAEMPFLLAHYSQDEAEMRKCQAFAHYRATKETDRATYQAMEALIHNLNTMHSRAGAQTPFSSINYGMDTTPEGRMVMKNIMLATEAGLGNGETPIFPIQIFRVKDGVNYNPGEPNYDLFQLAIRCSAKRLFPNFSFIDAPFNLQYYKEGHPETEIAYMGCRTSTDVDAAAGGCRRQRCLRNILDSGVNDMIVAEEVVNICSGNFTGGNGADNGRWAGYGVAAGVYPFAGGQSVLICDDATPFLRLQPFGGRLDQRVGRSADRHDYAVDVQHKLRAFLDNRAAAAGVVRFAQFHLDALHAIDSASLFIAQNFYRIVQVQELYALFLCVVYFFFSCRHF